MNATEVIIYFGIPAIMVIAAVVLVVAAGCPKFEEIRNPLKPHKIAVLGLAVVFLARLRKPKRKILQCMAIVYSVIVTLISIFALFVGFA